MPFASCANATERRLPSSWFAIGVKSVIAAPGASTSRCAARNARAAASAVAGSATAWNVGTPGPHMRSGTLVSRSISACQPARRASVRTYVVSRRARAPSRRYVVGGSTGRTRAVLVPVAAASNNAASWIRMGRIRARASAPANRGRMTPAHSVSFVRASAISAWICTRSASIESYRASSRSRATNVVRTAWS